MAMEMFKILLLTMTIMAVSAQNRGSTATTTRTRSPESTSPEEMQNVSNSLANFVLESDEPGADDLDIDELERLHSKASRFYVNINNSDSHERPLGINACAAVTMPTVYQNAEAHLASSKFPNNLFSSNSQLSTDVETSCPNNRHYVCQTNTRRLYWFPLHSYGGLVHQFCYLPWAAKQNVTYSTCKCDTCKHPYATGSLGKCKTSCFQRRRMLVRCYHYHHKYISSGNWYWTWATRNLPQSCKCIYK